MYINIRPQKGLWARLRYWLLLLLWWRRSGCEIMAVSHTEVADDPERFRMVNQEEFIREYLSPEGKEELFGHPPPFSDAEIMAKVEKCETSTGITNRVFFKGSTVQLALIAARKALREAGITAAQLGGIVFGSNTGPGYPSGADLIKFLLGMKSDAMCFDVEEACTTGSHAVFVGDCLVRRGCEYVLVITPEKATTLAKQDNWKSSNLFGDAASAMVLKKSRKDSYYFFDLISDPFADPGDPKLLKWKLIYKDDEGYFYQDGKNVHKLVGRLVPNALNEAIKKSGLKIKKIHHIIPHQPSAKTSKLLEDEIRKLWPNFSGTFHKDIDTGNISSASTLSLFSKLLKAGKIKPGEIVVFITFGAGFSIGVQAAEVPKGILTSPFLLLKKRPRERPSFFWSG